jgi:hypothetical protein
VACLGPARAQTELPELPTLSLDVTAGSRLVEIRWPEVPDTQGRRITGLTRGAFGADSVQVDLVGEYSLECDYRLRVTKIPQDPGFNRQVQIRYTIAENTSAIGAPLREGTVVCGQPGVVYPFQTDIAGNLGIRMGGNINPPEGPLGTVTAAVTGLNTTSSITTNYFVAALNAVSSLSDTLRVQVVGPVARPVPATLPASVPRTTLAVTSSAQTFPIQDGQTISFTDGGTAPGDTLFWTAKRLFAAGAVMTADLQAFEGYHVWRSDLPDVNDFTLLGEVRQCDSKFDFVQVDGNELETISIRLTYDPFEGLFTLADSTVHDDFPYRYAVSTFDRGFLGNEEDLTFEGPLTTSEKLYPAAQARNRSSAAYVVPNPYSERSDWQEGGRKIVFANLPTQATIRIFTLSTDYVATLMHGPGEPGSTSGTSREWDLRTDAGRLIAPGIYLYTIEGTNRYDTGGGTQSEAYQQTGKFMIAR